MKRFIVFLVIMSFLGCYSDKPKKPDNLIPKDKMADILYDVFILTSAKGTHKTTLENKGIYPEDYVFEKYNIDSLQFALSNDYYVYYGEEYEFIMSRVETRIKKDKDKYQKLVEEEGERQLKKKDSIKKARAVKVDTTTFKEQKTEKKPVLSKKSQ